MPCRVKIGILHGENPPQGLEKEEKNSTFFTIKQMRGGGLTWVFAKQYMVKHICISLVETVWKYLKWNEITGINHYVKRRQVESFQDFIVLLWQQDFSYIYMRPVYVLLVVDVRKYFHRNIRDKRKSEFVFKVRSREESEDVSFFVFSHIRHGWCVILG